MAKIVSEQDPVLSNSHLIKTFDGDQFLYVNRNYLKSLGYCNDKNLHEIFGKIHVVIDSYGNVIAKRRNKGSLLIRK